MTDEGPERRDETEEEELQRLSRILGADGDEEFEAKVNDPAALAKLEEELAAIDDKFESARKEREKTENALDAEMESRLQELDQKAKDARKRQEGAKKEIDRRLQDDHESAKGLGTGLSVAYSIIGLPLAGALIGWLIDRGSGGNLWTGICMLIGMALAIVMSIVILNRANQDK